MSEIKQLYSFSSKVGDNDVRIVLKKPSHRELEESEFEYSAVLSSHIRKGIVTKAMLAKKYEDQGGVLPSSLLNDTVEMRKKLRDSHLESLRLQALGEKRKLSPVEKAQLEKRLEEIESYTNQLVELEQISSSVYNHTADNLADTHMIQWWLFNLVHTEGEDGSCSKIFDAKEFEACKDAYYDLEESNPELHNVVTNVVLGLVSMWYYNTRMSEDDFKIYEKEFSKRLKQDGAEENEEAPIENEGDPEPEPKPTPRKKAKKQTKKKDENS